jgi:hypothetical protein
MASKLKKLAIIVSGWHYPSGFYEGIANQTIPKGWTVDLFVVSHRDPSYATMPNFDPTTKRGKLDATLYKGLATKEEIERLGFNYKEYPNDIGDWGNTNQWLEDNDYKKYDLLLLTHDDNLILRDDMLLTVCKNMYPDDWLILSNSVGVPAGSLRGSFEFFKREMLDLLGGKFDMSQVKMSRVGKYENPTDWGSLYDWNSTVTPLTNLLTEKNLWERVIVFSPIYRISLFVVEGERGLVSSTQASNTAQEEEGIDWLYQNKIVE